jgi:hypothetical protein
MRTEDYDVQTINNQIQRTNKQRENQKMRVRVRFHPTDHFYCSLAIVCFVFLVFVEFLFDILGKRPNQLDKASVDENYELNNIENDKRQNDKWWKIKKKKRMNNET